MDTNFTPEQPANPPGRTSAIHRILAARRAAATGITPENTPENEVLSGEKRSGDTVSASSGSVKKSRSHDSDGGASPRNASSTQRGVGNRMMLRRRAREIAFQTLYQMDQNLFAAPTVGPVTENGVIGSSVSTVSIGNATGTGKPTVIRAWLAEFIRRRLRLPEQIEFARSLVLGTKSYREQIDELIGNSATHWRLERMTATDRTILRLGAYELLHSPTPARVAVNEAVELAKRYGTAQSAAFVNGILDFLLRTHAKEKDAREQAARRKN